MNTLHDTTRSYPRTLSQAFPDVRAHCIEGPEPRDKSFFVLSVCLVGLFVLTIIVSFFWSL